MSHELPSIEQLEQIRFDPDFLAEFRRDSGCVIRTFESVAEAKATDTEYSLRIMQLLDSGPQLWPTLDTEDLEEIKERIREMRMEEQANIEALFRRIQTYTTPLGIALSQMTMQQRITTIANFERFMAMGDKIAISTGVHMFHLGKVRNLFVSLSDEGRVVRLHSNEHTHYSGYIFRGNKLS